MEEPKYLYKYRYFDEDGYHLDILRNLQLYFPSPVELNDPFDCKLPIRYDLATLGELEKNAIIQIKHENPNLHPNKINALAKKLAKELFKKTRSDYSIGLKSLYNHLDQNYGICSFSKEKNHNALWSLYSDMHKGFLIKFDKEILDHHFLQRHFELINTEYILGAEVEYFDEMPKILPTTHEKNDTPVSKIVTLSKAKHFSFENEYRYISYLEKSNLIHFPLEAISSVITGVRVEASNLQTIKKVCFNQGIPFQEAKLNPFSFYSEY